MFTGWGKAGLCAVTLYVGEGPRGSNGTCFTLCRTSVTPFATHNQIGPLWCCFLSGWAIARSKPLWVSAMNSPVRLGVSPAAASTSMVFSIRGLRLYFPALGLWVVWSVTQSTSCCFAHPTPQSTTSLGLPAAALPQVLSIQLPISAPPSGLDERFFFISLVVGLPIQFNFLSFSVFCF